MSVGELLLFFATIRGIDASVAHKTIDAWLERVELSAAKSKRPDQLSKGMAQKIQFVLAVLHEPELLILDEPFSGFDPVNVHLLQGIVSELKQRGTTIVFSTHQMEHVEQMCDEICLLHRARKVLGGDLREVKRRFGGNTLLIDFRGPDAFLGADLVHSTRRYATHVEVRLHPGTDAQELLRRAVTAGVHVRRFEEVEPSLHNIFISTVTDPS
jgi:ABC-2 type transport system ATP-binding protein